MQYSCEVQNPSERDSPVLCYPVERLFRRCKDRKGSFMVETTAWEARRAEDNHVETKDPNSTARPFQWAGNWHDPDTASSQNRPSERR
ncbi:hypothetical protein Golomagni_06070 [Golovinomyces magnicellulatus]|nr:hypothetical protein Golomagni_06070 [Golovinomyces magnicellulatus]